MRPVKPSTETETRTFIEIETQIERKKVANIYIYKWIADWNVNMSLFYVIFSRSPGLSVSLSVPEPSLNCHTVEVMIVPVLINHSVKIERKKQTNRKIERQKKRSCKNVETNSSFSCLCFCVSGPALPTDVFHMRHAIHCSSCQFIATF